MSTRTAVAVRCAPEGRMHHLLSDALPIGWAVEVFGPDGARAINYREQTSIIVTRAPQDDGVEWTHASIARPVMPDYDDLVWLHRMVFGDAHAYQCFVPPSEHINIHARALHLWGRADGARALPDFGAHGTI